jgi:hypothetical protein
MTDHWKPLPCEGRTLIGLEFGGNGKDAEVTLRTAGHPAVVVPLSGARWTLSTSVPFAMEMRADGDTAVVLALRPADGMRATLAEARVQPWSDGELLPISAVGSRIEVLDCVPLRIAITPSDEGQRST